MIYGLCHTMLNKSNNNLLIVYTSNNILGIGNNISYTL